MTKRKMIVLSLFWFGYGLLWNSLSTVIAPAHVSFLAGDANKTAVLSNVLLAGALVAFFAQPIAGMFSDRSRAKMGRRRPFMIAGSAVAIVALLVMGSVNSVAVYLIGIIAVQLFGNIAMAGYQGLIPDTVEEKKRGTVSGILSFMLCISTVIGAAAFGLLGDAKEFFYIYLIIAVVIALCVMGTSLGFKEQPLMERERFDFKKTIKGFLVSPAKHPSYWWLMLTYFIFTLAFFLMADYIQYYFADILKSPSAAMDSSVVLIIVLLFGAGTSILGGWLGDKMNKKWLVLIASILMVAASVCFAVFMPGYYFVLGLSAAIGIGYGLFTGLQWAFVTDCLPNADGFGKDMGIFNSFAMVAPQIAAPAIGGAIFAAFKGADLASGYTLLFCINAVCFLLCMLTIQGVRKKKAAEAEQAI